MASLRCGLVLFRVVYAVTGVATRYSDVGELYWKFVSDGWEVPSEDVACTVDLPVPLSETFSAGDNVRVWAHGPLSGTVTTGGNRVRAMAPSVSSGEYAELRVTMPAAWLSGMDAVGEECLGAILREEKGWANDANARRTWARVIAAAALAVPAALAIVGVVLYVVALHDYKKRHTAKFQDKYFRDVPSDDHPAVLGCPYHGDKAEQGELTATLM